MKKNLVEEKAYLDTTIEKFKEIISEEELRIAALPKMYKDDPILLSHLIAQFQSRLATIKKTKEKPYFARIDFKDNQSENAEEYYIGKVGVSDNDNQIITIDWRSPIASIYYDSNIGPVKYQAPEGSVSGILMLKRQYEIENSQLISFQDVDTVTSDEILKPYLNTSVDNRLKNIVSTIQAEQNEIIRSELNKDMVIQGVAGSGKTTVALHRIAYLVYNHRDTIKPEQYMVIGPNKFFINYISGVLPDLDVNNVTELTFAEIVQDLLKTPITIGSATEQSKLQAAIFADQNSTYEKTKVSLKFMKALNSFISDIEPTIIPSKDFEIKGYKILSEKIIRNTYNSIESNVLDYSIISKKIERTILLLGKYLKDNYERINMNIKEQFHEKVKDNPKERNNLILVEKELKNYCKQSLKKYFNMPKIIDLYSQFLNNISVYIDEDIASQDILKNITNLKKKKIEFEDLASLLYLAYRIYGNEQYEKYRHVVIDEAQDFGEFNFYVLKKLMPNATFSIFGDLAQSIYEYRSINNWQQVIMLTFNDKCELKYLNKSYRTTTEIMNSANNITNHLNLTPATPVIRHGKEVTYQKFTDNQISLIKETILDYQNKGYKSIAVICKDTEEVLKIQKELDIAANIITSNDTLYNGGLCIITSYLAKGLEFDGVIISDASNKKYKENKNIDMKLLYVAMTRPLHELTILYQEKISIPLQKEL